MYVSETKIRVRYAETDQMSFVYYGNYATYFEVARVEALRNLGVTYKDLEDSGYLMPVIEYKIKFLKPVLYDEELFIKTTIRDMPKARIRFEYECFNPKDELTNTAETTLVFLRKETRKPCPVPSVIRKTIEDFFQD
ncbi:MAG: thioesterase [Flavobacteriales bacterium]|nr:MAG: thioesterase [Flavobacteriales bacterium]